MATHNNSRELSGILIPNKNKNGENDPDRKGFATIDGVDYTISSWDKVNVNGPFFKLSFRVKKVTPVDE